MSNRTTSPRRRNHPTAPIWLAAVIALIGAAAVSYAVNHHASRPAPGTVNATDGDPAFVVPVAKPLSLTLDLPALSDLQLKYLHEAQVLPRIPIVFGIDQPPIRFSDNEAVLFVALLYSESALNPYDEYGNHKVSSIGCMGIGQLCGSLLTVETRDSDEANIYAAAREYRRLLDTSGDMTEAIASYKGQTTPDTKWQSNSVWGYVKVRG